MYDVNGAINLETRGFGLSNGVVTLFLCFFSRKCGQHDIGVWMYTLSIVVCESVKFQQYCKPPTNAISIYFLFIFRFMAAPVAT